MSSLTHFSFFWCLDFAHLSGLLLFAGCSERLNFPNRKQPRRRARCVLFARLLDWIHPILQLWRDQTQFFFFFFWLGVRSHRRVLKASTVLHKADAPAGHPWAAASLPAVCACAVLEPLAEGRAMASALWFWQIAAHWYHSNEIRKASKNPKLLLLFNMSNFNRKA